MDTCTKLLALMEPSYTTLKEAFAERVAMAGHMLLLALSAFCASQCGHKWNLFPASAPDTAYQLTPTADECLACVRTYQGISLTR